MPDVALVGGRVIDPESGHDAVTDVLVRDGTIAAIGTLTEPDRRLERIDVRGLVVAPGFIDLHSHLREPEHLLLQAADGVTTALDLEAGALPVEDEYRRAATAGMPVNYGYSASWALARMAASGLSIEGGRSAFVAHIADPAWRTEVVPGGTSAVLDRLESELSDGALGIGIMLGYAPEASRFEYLDLTELAARANVPTFTHARGLDDPFSAYLAVEEIIGAATATGAHVHVCHINSTAQRSLDRVHRLVAGAVSRGVRITTEAYPYGSGSMALGAVILDPARLARLGLRPSAVVLLETGERPESWEQLANLRQKCPSSMVVIDYFDLDDPDDRGLVERALLFADTAIASDAIPPVQEPAAWPIPPSTPTHPRTAGTFSRALRWLARDLAAVSLVEVISRVTLRPAQILADVAPTMRTKGRLQVGADADLVVFDPERIGERASYRAPCALSTGMRHVLVNGTFVVRDAVPDPAIRPGRPVRGPSH